MSSDKTEEGREVRPQQGVQRAVWGRQGKVGKIIFGKGQFKVG